uniref:NnrS family protein n=1 Tax=Thaumasiovibrio occultus TaxID=1891184 RepID=UPI000B350D7E|nr:NnrS family protein [Thaumasiovibrio occultus]
MINIVDRQKEEAIFPLWRLGFRPFFLLAGIYAIVAIAIWISIWPTNTPASLQVPPLWWHVHEMIFGFSMAVVAGFVLTAVQTWTNITGTKANALIALVALWLLPRVMLWLPVPLWLTASIESLFLLFLGWEVGKRVVIAKGWRNLFFVPLFIAALLANLASYASLLSSAQLSSPLFSSMLIAPISSSAVWQAMLWWFTLLLAIMGGRVIPFFTARKFNFTPPAKWVWLEWAANLPLALLFVLSLMPRFSIAIGETLVTHALMTQALMLVAGVFQLIRALRWLPWRTCSEPLVWSLHLGFLCIPASLLVRATTENAFTAHTFLHLFAIGALGGIILAMMARVTMGHTGRNIYQGPAMGLAYSALFIAALIRTIGVTLLPAQIVLLVQITGILWIVAFALYCWQFIPMLWKARVDGMPG